MQIYIDFTLILMLSEEDVYEDPHYVVFSRPLLQLLSQFQVLFSVLIVSFKLPSTYSSLLNLG
jgi:hypothetical protein